jgi:hypothetical protein
MALDNHSERHIKIEDNDGDKNLSKIWMHKECWHEFVTQREGNITLQKKAENILNFAKNKLGIDEEV